MPAEVFTQICFLSWGWNRARTQNMKTPGCLFLHQSLFLLRLIIIFRITGGSVVFSLNDVIFSHFTFCLLLSEPTLGRINCDSHEAVWLVCSFLSTDLSPLLWAQIKPPALFVCLNQTPVSMQIPGSIKINQRIPFCTGNCLGMS